MTAPLNRPRRASRTESAGVAMLLAVAVAARPSRAGSPTLCPGGPVTLVGEGRHTLGPDPRPLALACGGQTCVAAWEYRGSAPWNPAAPPGSLGSDDDILFARSIDGGVTWSAAAPLNTNAATDTTSDLSVALATDGAGLWIAVWDRQGSGAANPDEIMIARSVDDGATWSSPAPLQPTPTTATDFLPRIAHAVGPHWVAAWGTYDTLGGTIGADADIVASRSSDGGATWTPPVAVASDAAIDAGSEGSCAVACSPTGLVAIVWPTLNGPDAAADPEHDVRIAVSQDFGATWGPHALLSELPDDALRQEIEPDVAIDDAGRIIACWQLRNRGGLLLGGPLEAVQMTRSDDGGASWSPPMDVAAAPREGEALRTPRLFASGSLLLACWAAVGREGPFGTEVDGDIVVAASDDGGATWGPPRAVVVGSVGDVTGDFTPVLASLGSDAVLLTWRRETGPDAPERPLLQAQRLDIAAAKGDGADCDQDGAVDADAIAAGWIADCDGNGVPDGCQIAASPQLDCDEDGVLDACAIIAGSVDDCDGDGVPDSCRLAAVNGPGTPIIEFSLWASGVMSDFVNLRACRVRAGLELVDALAVEFHPSTDVATLVVMSDPDQDGNPGDAELLAAAPVLSTDQPVVYSIPPTIVGGAGEWYFVGMRVSGAPGGFYAHADSTTASGRAWTVQGPAGQLDLADLLASGNVQSTDGRFGVPLMLAVTPLGPSPFDRRGDGELDACALAGDLDGDGAVTGADLGLLLAVWGPCAECGACPADLDGDCAVGGGDLGLLLAAWSE